MFRTKLPYKTFDCFSFSGLSEYKRKLSRTAAGSASPPSQQGNFDPMLEYQGDDATTNSNEGAGGGGRVLKVEEELVLNELTKLLVHCGLDVPPALLSCCQGITKQPAAATADHAASATATVTSK